MQKRRESIRLTEGLVGISISSSLFFSFELSLFMLIMNPVHLFFDFVTPQFVKAPSSPVSYFSKNSHPATYINFLQTPQLPNSHISALHLAPESSFL